MKKITFLCLTIISIAFVFTGCGRPNGSTIPVINRLGISPNPVSPTGMMTAMVIASDQDGNVLQYTWTASQGWDVTGYGATATVTAPSASNAGGYVTVTVSDGNGNSVSGSINVATTGSSGSPAVSSIFVSPNPMNPAIGGNNQTATAIVTTVNQTTGSLTYVWSITSTTSGWRITSSGSSATITAPLVSNSSATITVMVYDANSMVSSSTTNVFTGLMEATYPVGSLPIGIAIDISGNAWISDGIIPSTNYVVKLNSSGSQQGSYPVGSMPMGIAIDKSGNVWVVNDATNDITELDAGGNLITTVTVGYGPAGIAIDASGQVWVTNTYDSSITVFSSTTRALITTVALAGYSYPVGIAIDKNGNAWVANSGSSTITVLNTNGTIMTSYTVDFPPYAIAIGPAGNVWVTSFTCATELKGTDGTTITTVTGVLNPGSIAIDSAGDIWVTNSRGNTVTEMNAGGNVINIYTLQTNIFPMDVAIDASGNVWVVNYWSNTVIEIFGIAQGPQYFPYTGPQFPGGGNIFPPLS